MTDGTADAAPLSAEKFALYIERYLALHDDLIDVLGRSGTTLRLRVRGDELTADVGAFYQAYARSPDRIDAVASSFVSSLLHSIPERAAHDLDALSDRIFPMLKPVELLLSVRERRLPMVAYREFLADLIITYVVDEQRSFAFINEDHLERWQADARQIHDLAIANLRRRTDERVRFTATGAGEQQLFIFSSGDGYDATRLLLTDVLASWARHIPGRLVVGIPNRDFLIGFSDANQDILHNVAAQIRSDAAQRAYGLTDRLFTLVGGQVREYELE